MKAGVGQGALASSLDWDQERKPPPKLEAGATVTRTISWRTSDLSSRQICERLSESLSMQATNDLSLRTLPTVLDSLSPVSAKPATVKKKAFSLLLDFDIPFTLGQEKALLLFSERVIYWGLLRHPRIINFKVNWLVSLHYIYIFLFYFLLVLFLPVIWHHKHVTRGKRSKDQEIRHLLVYMHFTCRFYMHFTWPALKSRKETKIKMS